MCCQLSLCLSAVKMRSILLVVAALLAISDAASPPNLANTFIATGEAEVHTAEGTSIGGKCKRRYFFFFFFLQSHSSDGAFNPNKNAVTIARDQKNNMGLEEIEYGGTNQVAKMIQRYDQKKTYYVRG